MYLCLFSVDQPTTSIDHQRNDENNHWFASTRFRQCRFWCDFDRKEQLRIQLRRDHEERLSVVDDGLFKRCILSLLASSSSSLESLSNTSSAGVQSSQSSNLFSSQTRSTPLSSYSRQISSDQSNRFSLTNSASSSKFETVSNSLSSLKTAPAPPLKSTSVTSKMFVLESSDWSNSTLLICFRLDKHEEWHYITAPLIMIPSYHSTPTISSLKVSVRIDLLNGSHSLTLSLSRASLSSSAVSRARLGKCDELISDRTTTFDV